MAFLSDTDDFLPESKITVKLKLGDVLPESDRKGQAAKASAFDKFRYSSGGAGNSSEAANSPQRSGKAQRRDSTAGDDEVCTVPETPVPKEDASPSHAPAKRRRLGSLHSDEPLQPRGIVRRRMVLMDSDDEASPPAPPPAVRRAPARDSPAAAATPSVIDLAESDGAPDGPSQPEMSPEEQLGPLERCEHIAACIRSALEQQSGGPARLSGDAADSSSGGTDHAAAARSGIADSSLAVVSGEAIAAACGGAAETLKQYQLVGINFLLLLARLQVGGSILADEMGLGKTAQAICFLGVLKNIEQDPDPHVIVAPASLLENWQRELARWCPNLSLMVYHGSSRADVRDDVNDWQREQGIRGAVAGQQAAPFDVLLTTYSMFERDSGDSREDRKFLKRFKWSHIVLDEAHAIKSCKAQRTTRLRVLANKCKRRLFLTGTPLQNDLLELKTLLTFLEPDIFGGSGEELDALEAQMSEEELAKRMRLLLEPFLLRRMKETVASQLVAKQQEVRRIPMEPRQAELYQAAISRFKAEAQLSCQLSENGNAAASGREDTTAAATPVLPLSGKKISNIFVQLRKIAQHPMLVRSAFTDEAIADITTIAQKRGEFGATATHAQILEELSGYSDHKLHQFCAFSKNKQLQKMALSPDRMRESAKFKLLSELLPTLKESGSRVLLFSQWTQVMDLMEWLLQDLALPYLRLDGSTAVAERLAIVDRFNTDTSIFAILLSTRAGGQGLNLTGANTCIIHDCDFNAQIDRQAEDRCHRLGQTRPVTVYRLVADGTVDSDILNIAQRKLRLEAAVLNGIGENAGDDGAAAETRHMNAILSAILADKSAH